MTADARNIQTALDMARAKSPSGADEPLLAGFVNATKALEDGTTKDVTEKLVLIDTEKLSPAYLRKTPKYVKNEAHKDATGEIAVADLALDYKKGEVVAGVLHIGVESQAVVKFASVVDGAITVVR